MDKISPEKRSENMRRIKSKDTGPELIVRRLSHAMGYRYRLHRKDLPGKPDLVFPGRMAVIFVHGCFWHQHPSASCADSRRPKSNSDFWNNKLDRNVERDKKVKRELCDAGWRILTLWECETKDTAWLEARILKFLGDTSQKRR